MTCRKCEVGCSCGLGSISMTVSTEERTVVAMLVVVVAAAAVEGIFAEDDEGIFAEDDEEVGWVAHVVVSEAQNASVEQ